MPNQWLDARGPGNRNRGDPTRKRLLVQIQYCEAEGSARAQWRDTVCAVPLGSRTATIVRPRSCPVTKPSRETEMSAMIRVMPGQTRSAAQTHRSHMNRVRDETSATGEQTTIVLPVGASLRLVCITIVVSYGCLLLEHGHLYMWMLIPRLQPGEIPGRDDWSRSRAPERRPPRAGPIYRSGRPRWPILTVA